ncbi:hypothetical protein E4U43_008439 [Claviceps pusilla]|uniref:Uncharacterized protein n=1 Tax=Claviceps pusilla TaxID=123648 RepID=A0A9P7NGJ5_9HYPO|nr:hypothetical protein E4U43_008439 [Claviceps pusilla]
MSGSMGSGILDTAYQADQYRTANPQESALNLHATLLYMYLLTLTHTPHHHCYFPKLCHVSLGCPAKANGTYAHTELYGYGAEYAMAWHACTWSASPISKGNRSRADDYTVVWVECDRTHRVEKTSSSFNLATPASVYVTDDLDQQEWSVTCWYNKRLLKISLLQTALRHMLLKRERRQA